MDQERGKDSAIGVNVSKCGMGVNVNKCSNVYPCGRTYKGQQVEQTLCIRICDGGQKRGRGCHSAKNRPLMIIGQVDQAHRLDHKPSNLELVRSKRFISGSRSSRDSGVGYLGRPIGPQALQSRACENEEVSKRELVKLRQWGCLVEKTDWTTSPPTSSL